MTVDVERFAFLLRQKPICTQSPLKQALGQDLHRDLRAKYKLELEIDLMEDRCPNSFNCISADSGCIGRPFPIDNDIHKALNSINVDVTKGVFKGREVYLAKATVTCSGCPFQGQCETSCATQDSFLNRSIKPESNPPESSLVPYEDLERGMYKALTPDDVQHCEYGDWVYDVLPLDCLTPKQRQVIEMTLYERLEQAQVAQRLNIRQQVVAKHKQAALTKLEEFGKARKVISNSILTPKRVLDYYINNMTQQQIATKEGTTRQAVDKFIRNWRESNYL